MTRYAVELRFFLARTRGRASFYKGDRSLQMAPWSLRGGVWGCRICLAIPRGDQLGLDLGVLGRLHRRLVAVRRQVVNRKIGDGFLGTLRGIGREAYRRQIRDRRRAAANGQR